MQTQLSRADFYALLALMLVRDEISNTDFEKQFGFTIVGKQRVRLEKSGYIASRKVGRTFHCELTDEGWHRVEQEMSSPAPKGTPRQQRIDYALRNAFAAHMRAMNVHLADIATAAHTESAPPSDPTPAPEPEATTGHANDTALFTAYESLAEAPGSWVQLHQLRSKLAGERSTVDDLLRQLFRARRIDLIPEVNQKTLTPQDRAAAIVVGGEDKHLIAIGGPL
ncbi:hypothetical protein [Natronoglycomyces albus]|uniref:Uncharacterized protein n=1 Tax=Natronoglycomyces albus TaxID=2811108 RepID=A0A895XUX8_9ACTN|nr:hypothetical protein [Natronoglycomyces albus]QSB06030.1 hypothetical protein JQS30_03650 [Natronoglycomyces albus]